MSNTVLDLLKEPGLQEYPEYLRPYLPPLTRSLAAPPGSKLLPSRSGAVGRSTEHFDLEDNPTNWTPWGVFARLVGPLLSSGPQAGRPTRPAQAEAYQQNPNLWKLSGVAEGWSKPYAPTPGRQPTTQLAIGRWTPSGGALPPLPGNPTPGRMVNPVGT